MKGDARAGTTFYDIGGVCTDCKDVIANYWNIRSSTYKNGVNGFDEEERAVWKNLFKGSLSSGERLKVLDVGAGAGFLALLFAEMGHEVTGVDLSAGMLEKAKHNAEHMGLEVEFFYGDAENLPFGDNSFDLVVNKFLLWTLPQPSHALSEWRRVLKPGGRVFAIDGDWFDPRPDKRFKRLVSEWTERFVKKNRNSIIFRHYYGPIKNFLPLFEDISPDNANLLFSEMGFINIKVDTLTDVQDYKKNRQSLLQKLLGNNLIFLISGQKE